MEVHAKTLLIEKLKMQLAVLRRACFGRSSEKLDHDIEQLELLKSPTRQPRENPSAASRSRMVDIFVIRQGRRFLRKF